MRTLAVALLLGAVPAGAWAGPALGLRLGYESARGDAARGTPMSDVTKSAVPLQLDATWRFGPSFSIGPYYAFGFGQISSAVARECDAAGASCSTFTMRTGVEAEWAFTDVASWFAPWIGTAVGYQWAYDEVSRDGKTSRQNVSGWELLNLEGGADATVTRKLRLGPYVSLRYSQYSSINGYGIANKAYHSWLGIGVRAAWDF